MQRRYSIIALVLLTACFSMARADELQLADNAPASYTVVKGDTLWDISGKFLKKPWKWPEIWNMNREQIKDPHWIYPGEVIVLTYVDGKPRLSKGKVSGSTGSSGVVKLSPQVRESSLDKNAVPSIPSSVIEPFLTRPLVIEEKGLEKAPVIVAADGERVVIGAGNKAYVEGLDESQGNTWQIYRPGRVLKDPETQEILGYEATYLGDAVVTKPGNPAIISIRKSTEEINRGDRLVPATDVAYPSYSPHSPDKMIKGRIMTAPKGVEEIGQNAIVTISKGKRDGVEVGHVLATYKLGKTVKALQEGEQSGFFGQGRKIKLPDEQNGLVFIFRTFDKVSYGLIVQSLTPINIGDVVQTPE